MGTITKTGDCTMSEHLVILIILIVSLLLWMLNIKIHFIFKIDWPGTYPHLEIFVISPFSTGKRQLWITKKEFSDWQEFNSWLKTRTTPLIRSIIRRGSAHGDERDLRKLLTRISHYLILQRLDWKSCCSTGDAMYTGLLTGVIWSIKGIVVGLLNKWIEMKELNLNVAPDFNFIKPRLKSEITGIFKIRLVHIIFIAYLMLVWIVRGYYNGNAIRKWNRSSYRESYENCHAEY
jgi:hypothetical protein